MNHLKDCKYVVNLIRAIYAFFSWVVSLFTPLTALYETDSMESHTTKVSIAKQIHVHSLDQTSHW